MPRCSGTTKAGKRCRAFYRTADPGLARGTWYCYQHQEQRPRPEPKQPDRAAPGARLPDDA